MNELEWVLNLLQFLASNFKKYKSSRFYKISISNSLFFPEVFGVTLLRTESCKSINMLLVPLPLCLRMPRGVWLRGRFRKPWCSHWSRVIAKEMTSMKIRTFRYSSSHFGWSENKYPDSQDVADDGPNKPVVPRVPVVAVQKSVYFLFSRRSGGGQNFHSHVWPSA